MALETGFVGTLQSGMPDCACLDAHRPSQPQALQSVLQGAALPWVCQAWCVWYYNSGRLSLR
eukprot:365791-Chlamydomonas_euryale.AAC.8